MIRNLIHRFHQLHPIDLEIKELCVLSTSGLTNGFNYWICQKHTFRCLNNFLCLDIYWSCFLVVTFSSIFKYLQPAIVFLSFSCCLFGKFFKKISRKLLEFLANTCRWKFARRRLKEVFVDFYENFLAVLWLHIFKYENWL